MERRWLRRLLVVALTAAVVAPTTAYATHVFDDVEDDFTHAPGIEYVAEKGITTGCDADNYCPNNPLTRAQMATFLFRASGNDPETAPSVNADTIDGLDSTELGGAVGPQGPEGPPGPAGADGSPNPFDVTTSEDATTTTAPLARLPNSVAGVIVPEGRAAVITARFSAESACQDGAGYCVAQILLDGAPMTPDSGTEFAFDSTNQGAETGGSWEAHSMERLSEVVGPGNHFVEVQVGTTANSTTFRVDDWMLFVEAHLLTP